jgi:LPXTG-motif cell wall-anchored protein
MSVEELLAGEPKVESKKRRMLRLSKKYTKKRETKSGPILPNTASPLFNMLAIGITILLIGSAVLFVYVRKNRTA